MAIFTSPIWIFWKNGAELGVTIKLKFLAREIILGYLYQ